MEVKELRKYRNTQEKKILVSHETNAFGIQWALHVNIRQRDNRGQEEEEDTKFYIFIFLCTSQTM